jgi:hypothetical protein
MEKLRAKQEKNKTSMTRLEAAQLENRIVTRTGDLDAIVGLLAHGSLIWHNWSKAIFTELADGHTGLIKEIRNYMKTREADDCKARNIKNKKVAGLKQLSIMIDILAETFRVIEGSVDKKVTHGRQK